MKLPLGLLAASVAAIVATWWWLGLPIAMPPAGPGDDGKLPDSLWPAGFAATDLESFFGGLELLPPGISHGPALCGTGYKESRHG